MARRRLYGSGGAHRQRHVRRSQSKSRAWASHARPGRPLADVRALVQRVSSASVAVDGRTVAAIGPGLLVLLGVRRGDDRAAAERIVRKLLALRVFEDDDGRMNLPVAQADGELLCVSNFTLYGDA